MRRLFTVLYLPFGYVLFILDRYQYRLISLQQANTIAPRQLDLTGIRLLGHAAFALADTLAVEWGLRKLILKDCELDDFVRISCSGPFTAPHISFLQGLKPILHALLLNQSLPYLCLASNKRFKTSTFQLIGAYAQKVRGLRTHRLLAE